MSAVTASSRLMVASLTSMTLMLAACGGMGSSRVPATRTTRSAVSSTSQAASAATVPCTPAAIHHGAPPAWTASAFSGSNRGFTVPYAVTTGKAAAAFYFAPTLRAGHPTNPANKVLWVVRFRRDGHPLIVTARLSTDRREVVRIPLSPDSSPGEIYPSYIDLPTPGCWRLELAWGTHHASVDVLVHAA